MIFELSIGFDRLSADDLREYSDALEHLVSAHGRGDHILVPRRSTAEGMLELEILSSKQAGTVRSILDRLPELRSRARSCKYTVLLVPNEAPCATENPNNWLVIPLSALADEALVRRCRLIVEDAVNDGGYILKLAKSLARRVGYDPTISFDLYHGAGGRIAHAIENGVLENQPFLCICDSDRAHPGAAIGGTAQAATAVPRPQDCLGALVVLEARELENLIPLEFGVDVYEQHPVIVARLSEAQRIEAADLAAPDPANHLLPFVDFKSGFSRGYVQGLVGDARTYYLRLWKAIHPSSDHDPDADGDEVIWEGISGNFLRLTVEYLTDSPPRRLTRLGACAWKSTVKEEIVSVSEHVLSFGASEKPYRSS